MWGPAAASQPQPRPPAASQSPTELELRPPEDPPEELRSVRPHWPRAVSIYRTTQQRILMHMIFILKPLLRRLK